jgi:hypothetical protein
MKKLLFVAIVGALVACGEATTEAEVKDTVTPVPAVIDTLAAKVDSVGAMIDSTAAKVDSLVK